MQRLIGVVLMALMAGGVLIACGENGGGGGGGGGGGSAAADTELLQETFLEALCEAAWECTDSGALVANFTQELLGRVSSVEECKNMDLEELLGGEEDPNQILALEEGRIVINRSQAGTCKAAIKDAMCSTGEFPDDLPEGCFGFFQGQRVQGETCVNDDECQGTLECNQRAEADQCYGRCGERQPSMCGDSVCESDEFCGNDQVCTTRREVGGECDWYGHCQPGLACSRLTGECTEIVIRSSGQECIFGEEYCTPGTSCLVSDLTPTSDGTISGTCTPIGESGATCLVDSNCRVELECNDADPQQGEFGECGTPQLGADGDRCDFSDECESEVCDHAVGECVSPRADGESCERGVQCESGECEAEECAPLLENGESCFISRRCESGNCQDGECADPRADGESCFTSSECASEYCDFDSQTCQADALCRLPEENGEEQEDDEGDEDDDDEDESTDD